MTDKAKHMTQVELKPCPFCGCHGLSAAYPRIIRDKACGVVECHTDNCYAMIVADTLPQAIAAWNTRALEARIPQEDEVDRVADAIHEARLRRTNTHRPDSDREYAIKLARAAIAALEGRSGDVG